MCPYQTLIILFNINDLFSEIQGFLFNRKSFLINQFDRQRSTPSHKNCGLESLCLDAIFGEGIGGSLTICRWCSGRIVSQANRMMLMYLKHVKITPKSDWETKFILKVNHSVFHLANIFSTSWMLCKVWIPIFPSPKLVDIPAGSTI